jgi:hypothetical protein
MQCAQVLPAAGPAPQSAFGGIEGTFEGFDNLADSYLGCLAGERVPTIRPRVRYDKACSLKLLEKLRQERIQWFEPQSDPCPPHDNRPGELGCPDGNHPKGVPVEAKITRAGTPRR